MGAIDDLLKKQDVLLQNLKKNMPSLESLLREVKSHLGYEDRVYRYYHQSWDVYHVQEDTMKIYNALKKVSPHKPKEIRDEQFNSLVKKGTGKERWKLDDNQKWEEVCEPMVNAFLHAKYFLEMAVRYGKRYSKPPKRLRSGWAALLELYNIR
jgi:hypothetical protein